jgi:hypothetical protein
MIAGAAMNPNNPGALIGREEKLSHGKLAAAQYLIVGILAAASSTAKAVCSSTTILPPPAFCCATRSRT